MPPQPVTLATPARANHGQGLSFRLARFCALVLRWHDRALQRRRLAALSPRLLRDIGLTPEDVRRESTKPFWQP